MSMPEIKNKQLAELYNIFSLLGTDTQKNIDLIVKETCEVLGSAYSLYTRFEDDKNSLVIRSKYNAPADLKHLDTTNGNNCFEATLKAKNEPVTIDNLKGTIFEKTDTNVKKCKQLSYLGYPVQLNKNNIGALSVFDTKKRKFNLHEIQIISTLAKALSLEEERNLAQEKLKKSEESFKNIFNATTDCIFIHDKNTQEIIDVNDATCALFGYTRKELKTLSVMDLSASPLEDTINTINILFKKLIKNKPQTLDWQCKKKNGEIFWASIDLKMASIGGQKRLIAVVRDIDSQKSSTGSF